VEWQIVRSERIAAPIWARRGSARRGLAWQVDAKRIAGHCAVWHQFSRLGWAWLGDAVHGKSLSCVRNTGQFSMAGPDLVRQGAARHGVARFGKSSGARTPHHFTMQKAKQPSG